MAIDESKESDLIDRNIIESSIADLVKDVELLNNDDLEQLQSRIQNVDYLNSIRDLYHEMLPDGKKIRGINIMTKVENETIDLHITKTKPDFSIDQEQDSDDDQANKAEKGSELILQGYLKMADSRKKNTYVKLVSVSDKEKEYKIHLDESTLDNVVSSYWDTLVTLKVIKKGKHKFEYVDIQDK